MQSPTRVKLRSLAVHLFSCLMYIYIEIEGDVLATVAYMYGWQFVNNNHVVTITGHAIN